MKKLLDPNTIPEGKEWLTFIVALLMFVFWTLVGFIDVVDGALEIKGSSDPVTVESDPGTFILAFLINVGGEILFAITLFTASRVLWERKLRGD